MPQVAELHADIYCSEVVLMVKLFLMVPRSHSFSVLVLTDLIRPMEDIDLLVVMPVLVVARPVQEPCLAWYLNYHCSSVSVRGPFAGCRLAPGLPQGPPCPC